LNFTILFAAVASQDTKGDIAPFLDELESYCKETYGLPVYHTRGKTQKEFADLRINRCTKQRNKLEKVYNKVTKKGESCGTFDESYQVEFTTVPSAQNSCQALSEVTAEYNRFATTFLTSDQVCGVKRRSKLKVRMEIMEKQLINKADCECGVMYLNAQFYGPFLTMNNGDQLSSLGDHNNKLSSYKVLHELCKMEIWSGENYTGNRSECTGSCNFDHLGSVGNDRARSAKCICGPL